MDFQFSAAPAGHDETADGRRLKSLNVVDEFTRQALAIRVGRHCNAAGVIDVLEELLLVNGAPTFIRMDNGPEFIAKALVAWCSASGSATAYIPPGSPWENPFSATPAGHVESFNGRFRDEFLNTELFFSLKEAQVLAEAWRREYNDTGHTLVWVVKHRPTSPRSGLLTKNSHSFWTYLWGHVT
jgi:transposase InsO family protein